MMRDHKPISIADQVFEQLERDILTGKYPQGEVLSEMRLSSELGVSRTPIREAIRRLEQEHILEDTSRGLVVVGISRQDMLDIYEIRRQLEGLAAKRAAGCITEETLAAMKETLDLGLTIDERLADGYYYSKSVRLLKYLLEHPWELEKPMKEEVQYE